MLLHSLYIHLVLFSPYTLCGYGSRNNALQLAVFVVGSGCLSVSTYIYIHISEIRCYSAAIQKGSYDLSTFGMKNEKLHRCVMMCLPIKILHS